MRGVVIEPGVESWRSAARALLAAEVPPDRVAWRTRDDGQALLLEEDPPAAAAPGHRVPRDFLALAETVACHADPERWALLYRALWRLTHGERALLQVASDPDVHRLRGMEKAVRRESHKMKAFVRFRAVEVDGDARFVAWFEPAHAVVERTAPFFAERFPAMRWSILTPLRSAHWNGQDLAFTPGVSRSHAPFGDDMEEMWRTYYASTFNPARLRTNAMRAEMPVRYWKNLPEAELIAPLIGDAPDRVRRMIAAAGDRS